MSPFVMVPVHNSIRFKSIHVYRRAESTARWPVTTTINIETRITKDNKQGTYETNKINNRILKSLISVP
jgi:hypothetical protein